MMTLIPVMVFWAENEVDDFNACDFNWACDEADSEGFAYVFKIAVMTVNDDDDNDKLHCLTLNWTSKCYITYVRVLSDNHYVF
ncbi:hypothetical protein AB0758_00005 [Tolypothrix bouteillei VB521301_2]|uniref:hypothetical protein n=1 Tax=Tolypothrix bouteillei TaxID=1246981 RepID=UPI0038B50DAC